jgi:hypothetical protein
MEVWMHTFAFPRRVAEMARRAEAWWPAVELEQALVAVQGFLRGEEVPIDGVRSRIGWVAEDGFPKVPVVVAATGPRVIAAAARNAERIVFTGGTEPDRLRWAMETARATAADDGPSLGAYLNVAVHPDRRVARELVRGSTAIFARHRRGATGWTLRRHPGRDRAARQRL